MCPIQGQRLDFNFTKVILEILLGEEGVQNFQWCWGGVGFKQKQTPFVYVVCVFLEEQIHENYH